MRLRWLTIIVVVQALTVAIMLPIVWQAIQTHNAVCTYRSTIEANVAANQRYLAETPAQRAHLYGRALANVPAPTIRAGIRTQESVVHSLSSLYC